MHNFIICKHLLQPNDFKICLQLTSVKKNTTARQGARKVLVYSYASFTIGTYIGRSYTVKATGVCVQTTTIHGIGIRQEVGIEMDVQ